MKNDIVVQAIAYLETKPLVVFALAYNYAKLKPTRKFVSGLLEQYRINGKFDKFVEDFCIDLLSGRVEVDIQTGEFTRRIYETQQAPPQT